MRMPVLMLLAGLWIAVGAGQLDLTAADLSTVDRTIKKEQVYQTKTPKYGLLVFGPEAANRVWLVLDGDTLYIDRNGNGDLTEPGEKVTAKLDKSNDPAEFGYAFEVGDLSVGGKVHKGLQVSFPPLTLFASNPALAKFAPLHAALKIDPKALGVYLALDVASARLKGGGIGEQLSSLAGFYDPDGVLQFADKPADAPIVHFDGPMQITFYGERPSLRLGRDNDVVLVVGTPGRGPGTFAMLFYEGAIPDKAHPRIEIAFPAAQEGLPPIKEQYELKERC